MVTERAPKEVLGLGFNIAGIILIVVGLFAFGLSIVSGVTGEAVSLLGNSLPGVVASIAMIAVGIVFAGVGFYLQGQVGGKRKR